MVEETNRYHQQNNDKFRDRAKGVKWKDVTAVDLKKCWGYFYSWAKFAKIAGTNIGLQKGQLKPQFLRK